MLPAALAAEAVVTLPQFAVFGHPIAHSLSPSIHQAFARQCGIELTFRTIDAAPDQFAQAVVAFFGAGGIGANVTLPHKAAALALASARSAAAARVGAANVLTRRPDGTLAAHNTDGAGLVRDLTEHHRLDLHERTVLLLGAGGAAWGVAWSLLDGGVKSLVIANRSPAAAERLAAAIDDPRVRVVRWAELDATSSPDLLIHATSAGVLGQPLALPASLVNQQTFAYDLSYGAAAHDFLSWAQATGAQCAVDGLGMLVETAADAFALWHGQRPVTQPVYESLGEPLV